MEAVNGLKVYQMNDEPEYYVATSSELAIEAMCADLGFTDEAELREEFLGEGCPRELSDGEMQRHKIGIEDEDESVTEFVTFADHLAGFAGRQDLATVAEQFCSANW